MLHWTLAQLISELYFSFPPYTNQPVNFFFFFRKTFKTRRGRLTVSFIQENNSYSSVCLVFIIHLYLLDPGDDLFRISWVLHRRVRSSHPKKRGFRTLKSTFGKAPFLELCCGLDYFIPTTLFSWLDVLGYPVWLSEGGACRWSVGQDSLTRLQKKPISRGSRSSWLIHRNSGGRSPGL